MNFEEENMIIMKKIQVLREQQYKNKYNLNLQKNNLAQMLRDVPNGYNKVSEKLERNIAIINQKLDVDIQNLEAIILENQKKERGR